MANDFFRPVNGTLRGNGVAAGTGKLGEVSILNPAGCCPFVVMGVFAGGFWFYLYVSLSSAFVWNWSNYHYGIVGTDGVTVTPGGREYEQFMKEIRSLRKDYRPKEDKPETYLETEDSYFVESEKTIGYWPSETECNMEYFLLM